MWLVSLRYAHLFINTARIFYKLCSTVFIWPSCSLNYTLSFLNLKQANFMIFVKPKSRYCLKNDYNWESSLSIFWINRFPFMINTFMKSFSFSCSLKSEDKLFGIYMPSNMLSREVARSVSIFDMHFSLNSIITKVNTWILSKLIHLLGSFVSNQDSKFHRYKPFSQRFCQFYEFVQTFFLCCFIIWITVSAGHDWFWCW